MCVILRHISQEIWKLGSTCLHVPNVPVNTLGCTERVYLHRNGCARMQSTYPKCPKPAGKINTEICFGDSNFLHKVKILYRDQRKIITVRVWVYFGLTILTYTDTCVNFLCKAAPCTTPAYLTYIPPGHAYKCSQWVQYREHIANLVANCGNMVHEAMLSHHPYQR